MGKKRKREDEVSAAADGVANEASDGNFEGFEDESDLESGEEDGQEGDDDVDDDDGNDNDNDDDNVDDVDDDEEEGGGDKDTADSEAGVSLGREEG